MPPSARATLKRFKSFGRLAHVRTTGGEHGRAGVRMALGMAVALESDTLRGLDVARGVSASLLVCASARVGPRWRTKSGALRRAPLSQQDCKPGPVPRHEVEATAIHLRRR